MQDHPEPTLPSDTTQKETMTMWLGRWCELSNVCGWATIPVFSALGSGAVPTSGAVLAWMLIAVFVGSSLGVLREVLRGTERTRVAKKRVVESHLAPVASAHGCCEVA